MISQKDLTEKIRMTEFDLDRLNEKLKADPDLENKPCHPDFDPAWTHGHYLTMLVARKRALKECNGEG